MPAKITPKYYYAWCSLLKFISCLLHNLAGAFCVWVKALRNDFSVGMS